MRQIAPYYYKSRLAIVRESLINDVFELADNLRPDDIAEIFKSHHVTPGTALFEGFSNSVICFTVERNERAIAMFGVIPMTILGNTGIVWLLASPELEKIQRTFLRHSRHFIGIMLGYYPILINWVDVENRQSVKWLRWCKATMGPVMPYGIEQQPFQYFEFKRG
jgi:hypothetical protein